MWRSIQHIIWLCLLAVFLSNTLGRLFEDNENCLVGGVMHASYYL